MNRISLKARAKINLTLDVLGKRPDGYHELQMIMQSVGIYDAIYMERIPKPKIVLKTNLPWLPSDERNLAYAAAARMKEAYGIQEGVFIQLFKKIPVAAGLAGGSTDCAAVLVGMNRLFQLGLNRDTLCAHGAALGSDVPFCICQGTMLAEGTGCDLTPLPPCPLLFLVLAKPPVSVSTGFVYGHLKMDTVKVRPDTPAMISALERQDAVSIANNLCNVLESVTVPLHPIIAGMKEKLRQCGAMGALMSGSGPTVYGLFADKETAFKAALALKKEFRLKEVHVSATYQPPQKRL